MGLADNHYGKSKMPDSPPTALWGEAVTEAGKKKTPHKRGERLFIEERALTKDPELSKVRLGTIANIGGENGDPCLHVR